MLFSVSVTELLPITLINIPNVMCHNWRVNNVLITPFLRFMKFINFPINILIIKWITDKCIRENLVLYLNYRYQFNLRFYAWKLWLFNKNNYLYCIKNIKFYLVANQVLIRIFFYFSWKSSRKFEAKSAIY